MRGSSGGSDARFSSKSFAPFFPRFAIAALASNAPLVRVQRFYKVCPCLQTVQDTLRSIKLPTRGVISQTLTDLLSSLQYYSCYQLLSTGFKNIKSLVSSELPAGRIMVVILRCSPAQCCPSEVAVYCHPISLRCGRPAGPFRKDGDSLVLRPIGRHWANNGQVMGLCRHGQLKKAFAPVLGSV